MKKRYVFIGILIAVQISFAQKKTNDYNYLEDQLYISLTYNLLLNKPPLIHQNGFSGGIAFGFIKDLPINTTRTLGFGIGVGYSYNALIQNLKISQINGVTSFEEATNFSVNRLSIKAIDFPIEFRLRNSTNTKFKFWRLYSGLKFSYVLVSKAKFKDNNQFIYAKNIKEFNRLQYGLTLAVGYGTWNFFAYYSLSPLLNNAVFNQSKIDFKQLNVGLKFYIM